MDQYSINKSEDVELATEAGMGLVGIISAIPGFLAGFLALKNKHVANFLNKTFKKNAQIVGPQIIPTLGAILSALAITPFFTVKAKNYKKEASRVARYQAREE